MHFHVFSQGAGVGVGLVAASHFAVVGLVAGVDMRVLLPVAAVGEAPVTALEFTFERLLPCRRQWASTAISGGGGAGSSASLTPTAQSLPEPLSPALPRLLSPRDLLSLALPFPAGPASVPRSRRSVPTRLRGRLRMQSPCPASFSFSFPCPECVSSWGSVQKTKLRDKENLEENCSFRANLCCPRRFRSPAERAVSDLSLRRLLR